MDGTHIYNEKGKNKNRNVFGPIQQHIQSNLSRKQSEGFLTGGIDAIFFSLKILHAAVGWTEGKKRLSIDSGILWGHADMYKSLLGQKN